MRVAEEIWFLVHSPRFEDIMQSQCMAQLRGKTFDKIVSTFAQAHLCHSKKVLHS